MASFTSGTRYYVYFFNLESMAYEGSFWPVKNTSKSAIHF